MSALALPIRAPSGSVRMRPRSLASDGLLVHLHPLLGGPPMVGAHAMGDGDADDYVPDERGDDPDDDEENRVAEDRCRFHAHTIHKAAAQGEGGGGFMP